MTPEIEALAYPTGKFEMPLEYDETLIQKWIERLEVSPQWYDTAIENLD